MNSRFNKQIEDWLKKATLDELEELYFQIDVELRERELSEQELKDED